ncbi:uncharacterized protein A4U43_C09F13560 [Asparagus officinalis]|uniref:Anaphase-promoting complex subunit 13 n=1 Tax=Asparagus officinalis TaxID=4686 RepID=A0A5P1E7D9_ASPOF|nr:uncharacterized protein A4U43_C09F13560 [Asparagus officinalis]
MRPMSPIRPMAQLMPLLTVVLRFMSLMQSDVNLHLRLIIKIHHHMSKPWMFPLLNFSIPPLPQVSANFNYEFPHDKLPQDGSLHFQEQHDDIWDLRTLNGLLAYLDITDDDIHYNPPPGVDGANVLTLRKPANQTAEDA